MLNEKHVRAAIDIETAIIPSAKTIQATYSALKRSVEQITADSQSILSTLQLMGDCADPGHE